MSRSLCQEFLSIVLCQFNHLSLNHWCYKTPQFGTRKLICIIILLIDHRSVDAPSSPSQHPPPPPRNHASSDPGTHKDWITPRLQQQMTRNDVRAKRNPGGHLHVKPKLAAMNNKLVNTMRSRSSLLINITIFLLSLSALFSVLLSRSAFPFPF